MFDKIRSKFDELTSAHPDLKKQLEAGFLLALGGSVKSLDNGDWLVSGGTTENGKRNGYTVAIFFDWQCDCKAHEFSAPQIENFDGHDGKICKHIAAVAISRAEPLEPVASVFEFLARLVSVQWLPKQPGEKLPKKDNEYLPGTKVKVISRKSDGCIILKQGHKPSRALVVPRTIEGGSTRWDFDGEDRHFVLIGSLDAEPMLAKKRYNEWVSRLGGSDE